MHAVGAPTISSKGVACRASCEAEPRLHTSFTSRRNGFTKPGMHSSAIAGQEVLKLGSATRIARTSRYLLGWLLQSFIAAALISFVCMYIVLRPAVRLVVSSE